MCGADIDYNTIHGLGMLNVSKPLKSYSLEFKNTDGSRRYLVDFKATLIFTGFIWSCLFLLTNLHVS